MAIADGVSRTLPRPWNPNPKPQTLNPKPQTQNPSPQGLLSKKNDDPRGLDIGLAGAPLVKAAVALLRDYEKAS